MDTTSEEVYEVESGDTTTDGSRESTEVTDDMVDILHEDVIEEGGEEVREEENREEKMEEQVVRVDHEAEATRRRKILSEVLSSEQSYVHSLSLIVKVLTFMYIYFILYIFILCN
jgi:hypothetical protein